MKNTTKRLIGILFAAAMLFGVLTVSAGAAGKTIHPKGDPLTYTVLKDGTLAVTGCASGQRKLTIPSTVQGKTVSKIAENVCKNCSTLQSVTIGKSVKTIEQQCMFFGRAFGMHRYAGFPRKFEISWRHLLPLFPYQAPRI